MNPRVTLNRQEGTTVHLRDDELNNAAWYFTNALEDHSGAKRDVDYYRDYVPRDVFFTKGLRMLAADAHTVFGNDEVQLQYAQWPRPIMTNIRL
eukprot:3434750-Karenia_brevis.AAC.1